MDPYVAGQRISRRVYSILEAESNEALGKVLERISALL